ncbi:MAG: hypothetical protein H6600_02835 [Flavobacteriales bacterium]|nr:hypothetical protein [Flavobacteriales bacterium]MCB9197366.1 hypothetical protein [Flavobacteriales bacterium]
MRKLLVIFPILILFGGCKKKLEELEGNNVPYEETYVTITEVISMDIPNSAFNWGGVFNCTTIPFGLSTDYDAFIPTQNPNPYAHLVDDIQALTVKMELTNIPNCDFDMLELVDIYLVDLVDTCGNPINDPAQLVLPEDGVIYYGSCNTTVHEAGPYYNAVKLGSYDNFYGGIGDIIYLDINPDGRMDQFIHAQNFQTFAHMVFDKAFTESSANIKTTMELKAKLINKE